MPEELGLHQAEPHEWQKSLHLLSKPIGLFQSCNWAPPASRGHPLKAKPEEQSTPVTPFCLILTLAQHPDNLLLLADDLVRANDGGEGGGRQVKQLVAVKDLLCVRHDVAPCLLLQLLQEELLGKKPEADGVGAIQLSSQPLEEGEMKIRLIYETHLLAILAEILQLQVLSCLHHLQHILLHHLQISPHHAGEYQGQSLRRACGPLDNGDGKDVLLVGASAEQRQEELAVGSKDWLGDRVATSILVDQDCVVFGQIILQTICQKFRKACLHLHPTTDRIFVMDLLVLSTIFVFLLKQISYFFLAYIIF